MSDAPDRFDPPFLQRRETYDEHSQPHGPKEVFKLLVELLRAEPMPATPCLLDIGCATGELIHHLRGSFPALRATGIDNLSEFVERARARPELAGATFEEADALTYRGGPFDIVTCMGVLGIFDDIAPLMDSLLVNTKPDGRIFVQALFNDDDIDVRVLYRDNLNRRDWNRGFNIVSKASVGRLLAGRCRSWTFHPFEMPFDLPKRPETPHRAYTMARAGGGRMTVNGLCLMLPENVLEIRV